MVVKLFTNQSGSSMVMTMAAMAGMLALGAAGFKMGDMDKQMNGFNLKMMTEQYRLQTLSQVMSKAHSCRCLLSGLEFEKEPSSPLTNVGSSSFDKLGVMTNDCGDAPAPMLKKANYNSAGIKLSDIRLSQVSFENNAYKGQLKVTVESNKSMLGQNKRFFTVPLLLKVQPTADANKVQLINCSVDRNSQSSGIPAAPLFHNVENGTIYPATSGTLNFPEVPPSASGMIVQYVIGSTSQGRSDRYCNISGGGINLLVGSDSKGDGGQRFVAGTVYVPLDGCASAMSYACTNIGGQGQIKILAYVDTGFPPVCGQAQLQCQGGLVPDGLGNCVPPTNESDQCGPGMVFDDVQGCVADNSVSCPDGQYAFYGSCRPIPGYNGNGNGNNNGNNGNNGNGNLCKGGECHIKPQ